MKLSKPLAIWSGYPLPTETCVPRMAQHGPCASMTKDSLATSMAVVEIWAYSFDSPGIAYILSLLLQCQHLTLATIQCYVQDLSCDLSLGGFGVVARVFYLYPFSVYTTTRLPHNAAILYGHFIPFSVERCHIFSVSIFPTL